MKRTLYFKLARSLTVGLFGFAASAACFTDVYADDPDHPRKSGEQHVKVQIFFIPGDSTTPPKITRVMLHADGKTKQGGGDPCSGQNDCEGLKGKVAAGQVIVIPASGSTCVTVNWGGTWRTMCK